MKIIEVVRNINRGGFGVIDEVICDDGGHYARKQFHPAEQFVKDQKLCDKLLVRFVREVKTQKILPIDYFIPILFDDLISSTPYFIMPLADGVYFDEIQESKKEGRNPDGLGDILNALEFLHDKGLVHRDLKPQNILKHNGIWKLADFGLISQDKEILSQTITTSKQAFGTTYYCAPEQVIEFNRITPQADIYSFGAILHDIFTDGNRVPHSELDGPGEIGQIIARCTRHKKEQRFKSIKSIRTKLLSLLVSKGSTSKNADDLEWVDNFLNIGNWTEEILENFVFYLKRSPTIANLVLTNVNENNIEFMHSINKSLFNDFALIYLDWVYEKSFDFNYCDVVINNVNLIFSKSKDIEVKSRCSISAAELGKSHNRWYVMRYVVKMNGPEMDEDLAFRVALEIELDTRNALNFKRCVERISLKASSYHKLIEDVLKENTF
ncbi:MAG: protein kinase [Bacteroidia bacterium]|nr:protein kinase [Bacteroidia bacterium]MCF8427168.1 protein kinase [Bacteroidia bacterium]MCF8445813.1 protein kinase [Bacteroidia bacterium]